MGWFQSVVAAPLSFGRRFSDSASLAFLAGGIALEAFSPETFHEGLRTPAALLIIAIGLLIAAGSAVRWIRVERAMRHNRPLPIPGIVPLLSLGLAVAIAVIIGILL